MWSLRKIAVAVVGATGAVGEELLSLLASRSLPLAKVLPLASKETLGESVSFGEDELEVQSLDKNSFSGIDLVFFCTTDAVSKEYVPIAVRAGACVIDCSDAFRHDANCPLVVPEVNPEDLVMHKGIIVSPKSLSIALALVLHPLHEVASLKRCIVTALQSVSGAGKAGIHELEHQVRDLMNMREIERAVFPHQIAFNLVPETSPFLDNDYTRDEVAIADEMHRLFQDDNIAMTATSVRVPVFFSHALSVNVEFAKAISSKEARALLVQASGVHVLDNPRAGLYPTSIDAGAEDDVFVGRIRDDTSLDNALNLWIVGDNLRKGSALNCVQILEELLARGLLKRQTYSAK
ncbi:MAG: aspartate-semialdehyde dehydrogenase [Desulfovibrio sp.]|nr:aspartate-semialdehyde dehydrogenase [Desulfovibrio sp.]